MSVQQLAIFLENKSGRLAEVTRILAEHDINIRALSVADTIDFGILRIIVDRVDETRDVLRENGFTVGKVEVVAVQVDDRPGGLASVLRIIDEAGLNVEYMYAFVGRNGDQQATLIFRFDDMSKAIQVLEEASVTMIETERIQ